MLNVKGILISGPILDITGGTIFITSRSIMAKIVRPDELGKKFCIMLIFFYTF